MKKLIKIFALVVLFVAIAITLFITALSDDDEEPTEDGASLVL